MSEATVLLGDVRKRLRELPEGSVRTVVTSPPYWGLRDYGHDGQIGLEQTPDEYVAEMVSVFREVWRVLADDGTLWLNLGDSYAKNKQLVGVPWRVAFALQEDGWLLRQDIIWNKSNPKPEPMWGRCAQAHEYVFLLAKSKKYYFDGDAIRGEVREDLRQELTAERKLDRSARDEQRYAMAQSLYGENGTQMSRPLAAMFSGYTELKGPSKKSVWTLPRGNFRGAHFAVMPEALVEPCVLAGSAEGDTVLDPFSGSGTVGVVALRHGRNYIGCELNPEYAALSKARIRDDQPLMNSVRVIGEDDEEQG